MHQNILLWPCCAQAAGIRQGAGVKCNKITQIYKKRLQSLDFEIDNLNMLMDFIYFICQFCQFHDSSSSVIQLNLSSWPPHKGRWEIWLSFGGASFSSQ